MTKHQIRSKEPTFGDLTFEVQKLNTVQYEHGKDSSEYKAQHKKSVDLVKSLNAIHGHGYASLSVARSILMTRYRYEKLAQQQALEKAIKNKKGA